jgi:hypothetical protein
MVCDVYKPQRLLLIILKLFHCISFESPVPERYNKKIDLPRNRALSQRLQRVAAAPIGSTADPYGHISHHCRGRLLELAHLFVLIRNCVLQPKKDRTLWLQSCRAECLTPGLLLSMT